MVGINHTHDPVELSITLWGGGKGEDIVLSGAAYRFSFGRIQRQKCCQIVPGLGSLSLGLLPPSLGEQGVRFPLPALVGGERK